MKNIIIFVLVLLGLECFSQQGNPICPYNENGYTPSQVKQFSLSSSEISKNFRTELLIIVNSALKNSEENLILNEKHIDWIFQHVKDSSVSLSSFTNSCKIGNTIKFYSDKNFTGIVGVFSYGKCRLILYKTVCMNLLKVPPIKVEGNNVVKINGNNSNNTNTVVYIPVHDTVYVRNTEKVYVDNGNNSNPNNYQQNNYVGGTTVTTRTGATFYPDQMCYNNYGYGYNYYVGLGYNSNNCNHVGYSYHSNNGCNSGSHNNHNHGNSNHFNGSSHSSGGGGNNSYYGHRNGNHSNGGNGKNNSGHRR